MLVDTSERWATSHNALRLCRERSEVPMPVGGSHQLDHNALMLSRFSQSDKSPRVIDGVIPRAGTNESLS